MCRQLVLAIACLVIVTYSSAQTVTGVLLDNDTKQPVPYVNIGIPLKNVGTVSDADGRYKVQLSEEYLLDTIQISSVGYQTQLIPVKDLMNMSVVHLQPETVELVEVTVSGKQLKQKILGKTSKSKSLRGGFKNATLGHELGSVFKIGKRETFIKTFNTYVAASSGGTMKFRLNFYNLKNGLPNEKLVKEDILFAVNQDVGQFSLDLSSYNIVMKEDFVCTVELIENLNDEDFIYFSAGLLGNKLVYRETSHGRWEDLGAIGIGFNLTVYR